MRLMGLWLCLRSSFWTGEVCISGKEVGRIFMPNILARTKTVIIGALWLLKLLDRHGLC